MILWISSASMTSDLFASEAFCPLAWNGLYIQADGSVDNCCISKNRLGNINHDSIDDIVTNDRARSVRESMLKGQIVAGCRNCYQDSRSKPTQRETLTKYYSGKNQDSYQSTDDFKLRYADIRLRNTCNYGCIYCGPEFSSTIAQERKSFPILNDSGMDDAIAYFKKHARDLDRIYLAGGEPLMIRENETLLDEISRVNPLCNILVNTNLSLIRNNRIFDTLIGLPNVTWLVSAEDMGDRYEYIRYKGSWQTFSENLLDLKRQVSKEKISFNMVYLALNSKSILDFIRWLRHEDFETENINIAWVQGDFGIDARNLSGDFQKEIFQSLADFPAGPALRRCFGNIQEKFATDFPQRNPNNIIRSLTRNDKIRNLDSKKVFADIYQDVYNNV